VALILLPSAHHVRNISSGNLIYCDEPVALNKRLDRSSHKSKKREEVMTNPVAARVSMASLLFAASMFSSSLYAQSINPTLDDVFQLRVGPFFANFDTTVTVSGTDFDEDSLLGDSQTTVAGYATWRITPRLMLRVGYSNISRDDSETLGSALPIGGIVAPAGSKVSLNYETSQIPINLGWAFVKNDMTQFGIQAGVSITTIKNSINIASPGGVTLTPVDNDVTEPLPTVGLFWSQALSSQWLFNSGLGYMGLKIGDLDAEIWSGMAALEWRPFKNVGFGGAYMYNSANGTITAGANLQNFDYQYSGPFAYLMFGGGSR
jgi:hypothetical protein